MTDYIFCILLAALTSYLLGGVNGAIILSRLVYHEDIRTLGSKNPGFTNFKRLHGFAPATFAVMAIDILKTVIPMLVFRAVFHFVLGEAQLGAALTLLFCMLGHVFPVWYGFKGGKAVLSYLSGIWFVDWRMGLICFGVFLLLLFTVKYMSLSSMSFSASAPVVLVLIGLLDRYRSTPDWKVVAVLVVLAVLVIVRHSANIGRLLRGEESKFSLFSKKKKAGEQA